MKRGVLTACLAVVLGSCSSEAPSASGELVFPGAPVLLISVDTLRADRLGCYGYDKDTSPNLDAFARQAVLFEDMYSNSPKTASSHMSLFTSLLPSTHKVRNQSNRLGLQSPTLASNRMTLNQVLRRASYWTAAVAGGGNITAELGFGKGFGKRFESGLADVSVLVDRTLERFRELTTQPQPGYVFLHTYQVHGPYLPPKEFMDRFAPEPRTVIGPRVMTYRDIPFAQQWRAMNKGLAGGAPPYWEGKESFGPEEASYLSALYDGEVAYTDDELGRLFDGLQDLGLWDELLVVVLADHGEEFFEHGEFEHDQLFREHLHVPCLIKLPGGRLGGTRVAGLASLIDVMPTLLQLLELEGPPTMEGVSLVDAMASGRTPGLPVVAERVMFPDDYAATLRTEDVSVVFHATGGRIESFDLRADPGEKSDIGAGPTSPAARQLKDRLARAFANREALDAVDAGGTVTLDSTEQAEVLEALGYIAGDSDGEPVEAPPGTPLDSWPEDDG